MLGGVEDQTISLTRFALASTVSLGLLALFAWGMKTLVRRGPFWTRAGRPGRRLSLLESLPLDARRRLVLVRCDQTEHLLLIGGEHDLLVAASLPLSQETPACTAKPAPLSCGPASSPASGSSCP